MARVSLRNWLDWRGGEMIKDLVVHIGDPKTGTSSIQKALQLRACHCDGAVIVPQRELNASALANSLNPNKGNKKKRVQARQRLFSEKAEWAQQNDGDIGVISAEFFSAVPPKRLQRALQEFLPDYAQRVRVIAYVRPHAARALSGYAQRIKTGSYVGSFDDFIRKLSAGTLVRYSARFGPWQDQYGDRFSLRPFVRREMYQEDVVPDFFREILDGRPFTLDRLPSTNESLALEELTALQRLQQRFVAQEVPQFLRLALGAALGRALAVQEKRYRGKLKLHRVNAEVLHRACLEDARELDRRFFGKALMEGELDRALEGAEAEPAPMDIEAFYSAGQLALLDRVAEALAALVKERPYVWRNEYQRRNGQRFDSIPSGKEGRAQRKHADQVWALLDELASGLQPGSVK